MSLNELFIKAVKEHDVEVMELLLKDKRVDPSTDNDFAILRISQTGPVHIIKLLLEDTRVDPGYSFNVAIQYASRHGQFEIVELLLKDNRVNPCDMNNWAIKWASENNHWKIVELLMKDERVCSSIANNIEINQAIEQALENGHWQYVKLLISNINDLDKIRSLAKETDKKRIEKNINYDISKLELTYIKKLIPAGDHQYYPQYPEYYHEQWHF